MNMLFQQTKLSKLIIFLLKISQLVRFNKSTNFNKKSHFKVFFYVSYDTYNFAIRYDSYDTHTVSYDLRALMIRQYEMKFFFSRYNTYRVSYDTDNYEVGQVGWTWKWENVPATHFDFLFYLVSNNLIILNLTTNFQYF